MSKDYQTLEFLPELSLYEIQQRIFIQKTPLEQSFRLKNYKETVQDSNEDSKIFYE